jgi:hypothetical protein
MATFHIIGINDQLGFGIYPGGICQQ